MTRPRFAGRRRPGRTSARGFTVLEILVAVALVGVLATLALPSYAIYVARARLFDGAMKLSDHHAKMEQYFLDQRSYVDAGGNCAVPAAAALAGDAFDIACSATASTHRITATGRASNGMGGFVLAIDETGQRFTVALPAGWTRTADCWTTRPDGSCL